MPNSLEGRVALVTGAATGIGAETARLLAARGATVIVADLDGTGAASVAAELEAHGAQSVSFDVSDEAAVQDAVQDIVGRCGRIDILHNNAAIQNEAQRAGDLDVVNMNTEAWDRAMAVNVRGPMLLCKHVIPHMLGQGRGSIIHSSSGFGLLGEVTLTAYGTSKAALINLSRFIATQYGKRGIRSNVVAIGFVLTETAIRTTPQAVKDVLLSNTLTPALGTPRDIAETVAFLASDAAAFITGSTLTVDGGFTAHQASFAQFNAMFAEHGSMQL